MAAWTKRIEVGTGVIDTAEAGKIDAQGTGAHRDLDQLGKLGGSLTAEMAGQVDRLYLWLVTDPGRRGRQIAPGRGRALEFGGKPEAEGLETLPLAGQAHQVKEHLPEVEAGIGVDGAL